VQRYYWGKSTAGTGLGGTGCEGETVSLLRVPGEVSTLPSCSRRLLPCCGSSERLHGSERVSSVLGRHKQRNYHQYYCLVEQCGCDIRAIERQKFINDTTLYSPLVVLRSDEAKSCWLLLVAALVACLKHIEKVRWCGGAACKRPADPVEPASSCACACDRCSVESILT
jgi:hypothetical protein